MALTRPQMPEKPPVAAKPRFKPPLLPPKPTASLFILSPPSTAKASSSKSNVFTSQKRLSNKASNASSCSPGRPAEVKHSPPKEVPPISENAPVQLPKPPPLPSVPPPIQRRGPVHSGSSTLPASFRNRHTNQGRLPTSPTINSVTSESPSSPVSHKSNKSLQRNMSPPLPVSHKPQHHTTLHRFHTFSERHHNKSHFGNQAVHPLMKDTPQNIQDKCISPRIESQKSYNSNLPPPVLPKPAVSQKRVPLLSESSPSKPFPGVLPKPSPSEAFPGAQPKSSPSAFPGAIPKSSSLAKEAVILNRPAEGSHQHTAEVTEATDVKTVAGKKADVPPPVPKNPPRAGVSRKSRSPNAKIEIQAVEPTPVLEGSQPGAQCVLPSCDNSGDSRVLRHSPEADSQLTTRDKVQKLLQRHQHTIASACGRSSAPIHAFGTNQKPEPSKTSITDSPSSSVHKTKAPPKERLRSGSAVQSSLEPVVTSNRLKAVNSSRFGQNKANQTAVAQNTKPSVSLGGEPELRYIEVYRGDTSADVHSHSIGGPDRDRQLQNNVEVNIGSDKTPREFISRTFAQYNAEQETSDEFPGLVRDQPEETCDMLKEIEELLRRKLGHSEFDIESKHIEAARVCSGDFYRQNSEQRHVSNEVISVVESVSKPSLGGSSSCSPPRLGHHTGECANLRNLQSLGRPIDTSTIDPPSNQIFGKGTGFTSDPDKKVIPPKPKRTFLHRANLLEPSSDQQHCTEERRSSNAHLDVLEQNECVDSNPPPLPPRNKPTSISLIETEESGPPVPSRRLSTESCVRETSQASLLSNQLPSAHWVSPTHKVSKSRPSRASLPPPPPGPPRRAATFSPGDSRPLLSGQRHSGLSDQPHVQDTAAPMASHMLKKCYSLSHRQPDTDRTDVEAADSSRTPREAFSQRKETKKTSRFYTTELPTESSHSTSHSTTKDTPDGQIKVEKTTKSALLHRVAHGLGLRKSTKKSQVADTSSHHHTLPLKLKGNYVEDKLSTKPDAESLPTAFTQDHDSTTAAAASNSGEPDRIPSDTFWEATGSSSSFSDHPLSEGSLQSSSSERFEPQNIENVLSSGTDSEPEPDIEEIYVQRKAKKVFFIAKEIVSSESTFVDALRLLNVDFRVHISQCVDKCNHPIVPAETVNKILDFLPQLQDLNEVLLKDLSERVQHWDVNPRIADVFVKKGPFLKLYTSYIRNFAAATTVLEDTCKRNSGFAAAVKEFEMSPRSAKLALKHYMLKPIQRIPQYKLLLQDYLNHLAEDSLDYRDTINALKIVSDVVDHANNSLSHGNHLQKLLEVQRSLVGQFEVIQPGRVLIKQGELQKLSRREMQPRMFFLFSDVLLYTTPTSTGFKINNVLPLTGMKINSPKLEDYKFEFNIISVQRSFTLCASSFEEKEQWVSAIEVAVEENAKKHHTFVAVKQGLQMSLQDKDFILGDKAPVWVPDARVTMCMLCLLEFTLTLRRHHCRSCGRVVCSHCSENKAPLRYLAFEPARVCDSCYDKLRAAITSELERSRSSRRGVLQSEENSHAPLPERPAADVSATTLREDRGFVATKHESALSLHGIMDRFQKLRNSNRERRKPNNFIPSVLKEVHANDEGSDMCGYLHVYTSRKWKRLWYVVKGKVLYTYKASEDMAAVESRPLLGYEVSRLHAWFEGHQADLLFELSHQNSQPLTTPKGRLLTHAMSAGAQRLVFRTDSAASTDKWLTVLREASLT
ncbi:hypothetical protein BsWGS_13737 [Bradybaena similaris]